MFKKIVRNSVIHKWLLSYIFILIIPLITFVGSMMRFLSVYKNEIKHSNSLILEQARLEMDQVLYEAKSFVAEITIDPMVRKLLTINHRSEVTSFDLYQTTTVLNRVMLTKSEKFEFLVYFPRPDIALSNNSYNNGDNYFDIYLAETGLDKELWEKSIRQKYDSPHFFSYEYVQPNGKVRDRIVMVSPIMLEKHDGMYANIMVFIDESYFSAYGNEFFDRDTFMIIDKSDQLLYTAGSYSAAEVILNYSMLQSESNSMDMSFDGEKVIVSHIHSKATDWKYLIVTEEKSYMGQFNQIKSSMYISVILCSVIGFVMILYLVKQNYLPLSTVVKSIEESSGSDHKTRMNEFQYIAQTINQLQTEKKSTYHIMKQQKNALSPHFILNLVENRDMTIDLDMLERYDIHFQSDLFLVLTFLIQEGESPFPNDNEIIDDKEKHKMICLIFQNITEELLAEKNMKAFFFYTGRLLGFVINPPEEMKEEKDVILDTISKQLDQIIKSIHKYFLIQFVSACSDIHRSWQCIPTAYSEALQVIEYNSMLNQRHVVFYHDLAGLPKEENFYYPEEMENHIINNLKIGNEEIVCETIRKVINLNIENNSTPVTIRYLVVNIVGTIIKAVNQLEKKYSIPQLSFQTLLQGNNIWEICSEIEKNVQIVCGLVRRHLCEGNKPPGAVLHKQATQYVKKHYADKNLNVSMVADELCVHMVHLSRTFMEYQGDSLSNYINSVRLAQAKKLIMTGLKLELISEKVGFGSLRTFMRVFKRYEGITPGQFKETMIQTQSTQGKNNEFLS